MLRRFDRQEAQPVAPPQDYAIEILAEMEHNLERLTIDIPETRTNYIPLKLQRHVTSVPGPLRRFMRKVACAIVCYHDHHHG